MKRSEHGEQAAFFQWLRLKRIPAFSIPNAAKRSYKLAAYLKAEGMEPGVPDVFVPGVCWPNEVERLGAEYTVQRVWLGLFIEMKSLTGKLTADQKEWHRILKDKGYNVEVCYSAEEAIKIVEEYLK